jgi:hypothetical protein
MDKNMQHKDANAAWASTWTCSQDIDMAYGHTSWNSTYIKYMDIQQDIDLDINVDMQHGHGQRTCFKLYEYVH